MAASISPVGPFRARTLMLFLMIAIASPASIPTCASDAPRTRPSRSRSPIVTATWPGATAQEMRDQVADLLREEASGASLSRQDRDLYEAGLPGDAGDLQGHDAAQGSAARSSISCARSSTTSQPTLPAGVRGPQVNDEYGDVDTVLYAVTGDGADYHVLDKVVETLRQRLLETQDVDEGRRLWRAGTPHLCRIQPGEARQSRRSQPQAVFDSLAKQNAINDAGVFETSVEPRARSGHRAS